MPEPSPPWGDSPAGRTAIMSLALYLVAVFAVLVYSLAHNWPKTDICIESSKTATTQSSQQQDVEQAAAAVSDGAPGAPAANLALQGDTASSPS